MHPLHNRRRLILAIAVVVSAGLVCSLNHAPWQTPITSTAQGEGHQPISVPWTHEVRAPQPIRHTLARQRLRIVDALSRQPISDAIVSHSDRVTPTPGAMERSTSR